MKLWNPDSVKEKGLGKQPKLSVGIPKGYIEGVRVNLEETSSHSDLSSRIK